MIKQIPNQIKKIIINKYKIDAHKKITKYYSYLTNYKKDIAKITVAIKEYKNKYLVKQVAIHTLKGQCYSRDLTFTYIAGYTTDWSDEINSTEKNDYLNKKWYKCDYKYFNPQSEIVNINFLDKHPEYKYSCYKEYNGNNILKFLNLYNTYPEIEILMKLDLKEYSENIILLKKLQKDKTFKKFIFKNKDIIKNTKPYALSIIKAYNLNKEINKINEIEKFKKTENHYYKEILKEFSSDIEKLMNYLNKQNITITLYNDYYNACKYLNVNLNLNKNRYPNNFMQWHDIRIDQKETRKNYLNKLEKEKMFSEFLKISNKYLQLQQITQSNYLTIIAKSPDDLKLEGNALKHCVGRMNYDKKMINEQSLIFFIRKKEEPNKPYVTLEYSIKEKNILQCYAYQNTKPNDETINYIYHKWLPFANKQINKIISA